MLIPYRQDPDLAGANFYVRTLRFGDRIFWLRFPRVVRDIDPTLPVGDPQTMTAQVQENVSLDRFVT